MALSSSSSRAVSSSVAQSSSSSPSSSSSLSSSSYRVNEANKTRATPNVSTLPAAIDAWCQPAETSFLLGLPEGRALLQKSGSFNLFFSNEASAASSSSPLPKSLSIEDHVRMMDEANVKQACLSSWFRPGGPGTAGHFAVGSGYAILSNEQIRAYTTHPVHASRFVHIASVDLTDPVSAVAMLTTAVKEYGAKALRIVPWLWNLPPNDKLYYPLLTRCVELDIPFCTQAGHTGPMCPSEVGRPIPYLDELALRFPRLRIVAGHIGYPWVDEMISLAWKYDNVYIDTSAYLPRYYPPQLVHFMRTTGQKKVLFGTNFPQLTWKRCMEQVHELKLNEEQLHDFLHANAERVFKLQPSATVATSSTTATNKNKVAMNVTSTTLSLTDVNKEIDLLSRF